MGHVISRFRKGYWIRQLINYLGSVFIIGLCIYFSISGGQLDFQNALFWIACLGIIGFIFCFITFLFMELKQLIITDSGIKVNYIFRKKTEFIDYKEIEKMTTTRITEERGTGRTDGYY